LKASEDFGLAMFPEFLREGSALIDFRESPLSVIGTSDRRSAGVLRNLWARSGNDFIEVSFEEAEMLKLASNAFHALKTGFANEIGRLCAAQRIDPATVMELICRDTRLNLSPAYLRPGFPFGGSCLSKDLQALLQLNSDVKLPILDSVLPSNREHFELCLAAIRRMGAQRIGILGLTFKPGTDDLRQSPALRLAAQLQRENVSILAYDPDLPPPRSARATAKSSGER
jgi:GDP-mannose 6-dehydrogenase